MWKILAESFAIFTKYGNGKINLLKEQDVEGIFGGPALDKVSQKDKDRLIQLGWVPDPYDNWYIDLTYAQEKLH